MDAVKAQCATRCKYSWHDSGHEGQLFITKFFLFLFESLWINLDQVLKIYLTVPLEGISTWDPFCGSYWKSNVHPEVTFEGKRPLWLSDMRPGASALTHLRSVGITPENNYSFNSRR